METSSSNTNSNNTSGPHGKCANPDCQENGTLKCSKCSSVYYCSQACQKKHWSVHKTQCKLATDSSPKPASPAPSATSDSPATSSSSSAVSEPHAALQTLKQEIQRYFAIGDFDTAIRKSDEALALCKVLPAVVSISESIQLHINLSTAFIHMNRFVEAELHADNAVKGSEIAISQRPNQPQPLEVLSISLGCKAIASLSNGKVDDALVIGQKSLSIAESIYPKNDPRLHKPLRTLGMIYDKKGNNTEAEMTLLRAYTIIVLAGGPACGESQLLTEDLVNMFTKKNDYENAEKYARKNYKGIKDKASNSTLKVPEMGVLADSATRFANTLVRKGDHASAEPLIMEALAIRESKEFSSQNPLAIAYSLSQLAAIREVLGKLDSEVEDMLVKALEIFGRTKGPNSPEVVNTLNQLKTVRSKRKNGGSSTTGSSSSSSASSSSSSKNKSAGDVSVEDVDDDDDDQVEASSPNPIVPSSSSATTSKGKKTTESYDITPEERQKIDSIPPNDGISRMQLAGFFYEKNKFATAELLLNQAYQIFLRTTGPDHEHTKAARQNLGLVRNNRLNQLWMQVVADEVLTVEGLKISGKS
jgi:tetratricopeptide (TPR) repeat protein